MQYMGGKERIHKHILKSIEFARADSEATKYLEPFVGGASIASRIAGFDEVVLADAEPLVADVWNAARRGWEPYPIDLEQYVALRDVVGAGPMAGYAAFGVSFGGKKCTTGYGDTTWDTGLFWSTVDGWVDAGAVVLVSEYTAPKHWSSVWTGKKQMALSQVSRTSVERVFTR